MSTIVSCCIAEFIVGIFIGILLTIGYVATNCSRGHCDCENYAPPRPKKKKPVPGGVH